MDDSVHLERAPTRALILRKEGTEDKWMCTYAGEQSGSMANLKAKLEAEGRFADSLM